MRLLPTRLRGRRVLVTIQLIALAILLAVFAWAVRDVWGDGAPRLRDADATELALAASTLAAYYALFFVGWLRILAAYGIRVRYRVVLQAEMLSMVAEYVPGGVWTPAARVVALRRFGVRETPVVLASIMLEAGLSAIAGVGVFIAGLALVHDVDAPLVPLAIFTTVIAFLLHPRVFTPVARRVLRPFGPDVIAPLPWGTSLALLVFYALTWPLRGAVLFFLLRSLGGDPGVSSIPFLGGVSAVSAIVAVLVVIAPSGLGVREASLYTLLLAVAAEGVALGATILNRLAITVVEAILLVASALLLRWGRVPSPAEQELREPVGAG